MNADEALYEFQMKLQEAENALKVAQGIAASKFGRRPGGNSILNALDDARDSIYDLRMEVEDVRSDVAVAYFEDTRFIAY